MNCRTAVIVLSIAGLVSLTAAAGEKVNKTKTVEKNAALKNVVILASMQYESIVGSAVPLKIKVQNESKKNLNSWEKGKYWDYDLKLLDSKGRPVPLTQFGKVVYGGARNFGSGQEKRFAAGKQVEETLNLIRVFDLSMEGEYTLSINRTFGEIDLKIEGMRFKLVEEPNQ